MNEIIKFPVVVPVIDFHMRNLCTKAYPNHPKGCPNFGKRLTCPPQAPLFEDIIDMDCPVFAIFNIFPFGEHVERMRKKHKEWSKRQLECCLYWQGTARKQLRAKIDAFKKVRPADLILQTPEANGVNITATMFAIGAKLEWPPKTATYQVALAGTRLAAR